jgi:hypothetical protein
MSCNIDLIFPGRVHLIENNNFWASRGRSLYLSFDRGTSWKKLLSLTLPISLHLCSMSRLSRRLSRMCINHVIRIDVNSMAIVGFGYIFFYSTVLDKITAKYPIKGKRPLVVCAHKGRLIYGEYGNNPEYKPMELIAVDEKIGSRVIFSFDHIRHIHGVNCDPVDGSLWITTGDNDDESTIWHMSTLKAQPQPILSGSQQSRAVQLLFDKSYIYFGTDTPLEQNYIYRLDRVNYQVKRLHPVSNSVFYGCTVNDTHIFASVCEPSDVNEISNVRIYTSDKQDTSTWSELIKIPKDVWPMRLFQYGQVLFPIGQNKSNQLYFTPMGVDGDQNTYRTNLIIKD